MTCIVGIKTKTGVLLGGDTKASSGWDQRDRVDDKVFLLGDHARVAVGFTSSYRMGQILRFHLTLPALDADEDEYRWAVTKWVPEARKMLKEHGYVKVSDQREEAGTYLLAVRHRLFSVYDDLQVSEHAAPFDACGCGESYALGALAALDGTRTGARAKLTTALKAAARFSNGVGDRFTFVETTA